MTPPAAASGEMWPDRDARRAAGEPAVRDQRAHLAQPGALEERRRVQHLLHPRPAGRALVAHDEHVARLDLLGEDDRHGLLLALDDPRRALEVPQLLGDARGLDHRAVRGDVAAQHGQPAVDGVGVLDVADAAARGVGVERRPAVLGRERLGGAHPARRGVEQLDRRRRRRGGADVPLAQPGLERRGVHGVHVLVQQPAPPQLAEDGGDAAGPVDVLHVVVGVRRDLAQARHPARDRVDGGEVEVDLALLRGGEDVQHGVGRAAHGDVERHRVLERRARGDVAGQRASRRRARTSAGTGP